MKIKIIAKLILGSAILLFNFNVNAQELKQKPFTGAINRDPNYKPVQIINPKFNSSISTKANTTSSPTENNFIIDGQDIRVLPSANQQSEVHISVNKTNPNNLIASCNSYPGNYNQAYFYTTDGGVNWAGAESLQNSPPVLYGDPSTAFNATGRAYISSINPSGGYVCQSSTNNGVTWGNLISGNSESQFDKEMIAADNLTTSPFSNNLYAAWSNFEGSYSVEFNRSTDNGSTFSAPLILKNGWGQGTNVQTGVNGEVYICWAD